MTDAANAEGLNASKRVMSPSLIVVNDRARETTDQVWRPCEIAIHSNIVHPKPGSVTRPNKELEPSASENVGEIERRPLKSF